MKLVMLESPYAALTDEQVDANVVYAQHCMADSLSRGEAPMVPHILYTQVLRDRSPHERLQGMSAGLAWQEVCEAVVVYTDMGITKGMDEAIARADKKSIPVVLRELGWKS